MSKKMSIQNIIEFLLCIFILSGCGVSQGNEDTLSDTAMQGTEVEESIPETEEENDITLQEQNADAAENDITLEEQKENVDENGSEESDDKGTSEVLIIDETVYAELGSEELLDAFLADEIPAYYGDEFEKFFMFDQVPQEEWDYLSHFYVGERIDLDNDGENEQIINGPYGGIYLDARDGKVYVLAAGKGTAGVLSYTTYDNAIWIVHSDTSHVGRQMYWLMRYNGGENVADEFLFGAEYWDSPDDKYDENSEFTYRDEKISMEEYEELRKEILDWYK